MSISRFVDACLGVVVGAAIAVVSTAGSFAQENASLPAAVIAHPAISVSSLTIADLRDVLLGERQHWPGGQRVTVFRPVSGREWEAVLTRVLRLSPLTYDRRLANKLYAGQLSNVPRVVASSTELRRLVAQTPGGIGIISVAEVDSSVKMLRIDNLLPADPGYPVVSPIER